MPKLKWIGIITEKDYPKYQDGNIPKSAIKLKMPTTVKGQQAKSWPFVMLSALILAVAMFLKSRLDRSSPDFNMLELIIFVPVGIAIGFVLLSVHELLHASVYPKNAQVYIGIVKPLTFVCLASYPVSKSRFIVIGLLPYILGIVPLVLFLIIPLVMPAISGILFGIAGMGLVSPSVDAYNVLQVLRQVPCGSKVQFHKEDIYYFNRSV